MEIKLINKSKVKTIQFSIKKKKKTDEAISTESSDKSTSLKNLKIDIQWISISIYWIEIYWISIFNPKNEPNPWISRATRVPTETADDEVYIEYIPDGTE